MSPHGGRLRSIASRGGVRCACTGGTNTGISGGSMSVSEDLVDVWSMHVAVESARSVSMRHRIDHATTLESEWGTAHGKCS
jgi:hypothetical protein